MHKTELGIDFPQYQNLGIVGYLREESGEASGAATEEAGGLVATATAADEFVTGGGDEAGAPSSHEELGTLTSGINLESHEDIDLSGLGETTDETALINLPNVEEEIDLGQAEDTATPSIAEKSPPAPPSAVASQPVKKEEEGIEIELGDLDTGLVADTGKQAAEEKGGDVFDLSGIDLGVDQGIELGEIEEISKQEPPEKVDADLDRGETEAVEALGTTGEASVEEDLGIDLDLDLGNEDAAEKPKEPEKTETIDLDSIHGEARQEGASKPAAEEGLLEGLDLDLDLDLEELDKLTSDKGKEKGAEAEKPGAKPEDDLDIDLSDLKLE